MASLICQTALPRMSRSLPQQPPKLTFGSYTCDTSPVPMCIPQTLRWFAFFELPGRCHMEATPLSWASDAASFPNPTIHRTRWPPLRANPNLALLAPPKHMPATQQTEKSAKSAERQRNPEQEDTAPKVLSGPHLGQEKSGHRRRRGIVAQNENAKQKKALSVKSTRAMNLPTAEQLC